MTERLVWPAVEAAAGAAAPVRADARPNGVLRCQLVRTDADDLDRALDAAIDAVARRWSRRRIEGLVEPVARDIAAYQGRQFDRQLNALGVDVVRREPWLEPRIEAFTRENVSLIRTIAPKHFAALEVDLRARLSAGARPEALRATIAERYGVTERRAALIARDQSGKFFGSLNRERQSRLGITEFVWRTVRDNRVREEHQDLDGQRFSWTSPPAEGIPGEPVNCRCYAEPVVEGLFE